MNQQIIDEMTLLGTPDSRNEISVKLGNLLGVILGNVQTGILIIEPGKRKILYANQAALELTGASRDQIIGAECCQFFCATHSHNNLCPLDNPDLKASDMECLIKPVSSEPIPIQRNSVFIQVESESYLVETFISIAERKKAELIENEQRQLAEALRDTANAINQTLNLTEVLNRILSVMGTVVPNDSANIMLVEGDQARMKAIRGYDKLGPEQVARIVNQIRKIDQVPNLRRMSETGQPILIPDTHASQEWVKLDTSDWIHSYVSAPIRHKGKTIGFLNLNSSTPGFYSPVHAERLQAFAVQAAIAIENARLFESAQQELRERERAEEALQQAMNELEVRVEQRTAELRSVNEKLSQELTRRRQAEQALKEERSLLALRIEERTAELSTANAELARSAQMKDAFLASMSHELRTPLNAILNISESFREQVYGPISDSQAKTLLIVEESGKHLLSLINDILDISKIGAGKLDLILDNVSVNDVCMGGMRFIKEAAQKKQIGLSTIIDPQVKTVWADQRRLKQILVNLLSNAVKFTPSEGSVGLEVCGDTEKKQVHFTVWDTGIGIQQESIQRLFKPFVQLDNSLARHYEGTGLGLALVYNLVELHGGGIFLESEPGKGSRFTVTLNWNNEQSEAIPAPDEPANESMPDIPQVDQSPSKTPGRITGSLVLRAAGVKQRKSVDLEDRPRILLADDNLTSLRVLSDYLAASGYLVDTAANGADAIELARKISPDLILMDIQMPGLDGLEAIRRIRKDPRGKEIPIVALTALAMPGDRSLCLEAGADDYLSKPISLRSLVDIIEMQINRTATQELKTMVKGR